MKVNIALEQSVDQSYEILIDTLPALTFSRKVAIITNPNVAGLHLQYLLQRLNADKCKIITIPDGEAYKTFAQIETILESLFNHRFNRSSLLIAFGGGVIGDMTGFASAIFQRGIDFIQIPTTLLSQVDASVGGKTGINNSFGKNLIGAFAQPKAVYIDPYFLQTLPKREFAAGVAEMIKMAVTFDASYLSKLEQANLQDNTSLQAMIAQSVQIKAAVVAQDEKEKGVRAALNYGHTFAHVIENFSGYGHYLHGEAVAIGMVMANKLSVKLSLMTTAEARRIKTLLEHFNLPTHFHVEDSEAFYDAFFLDKKSGDKTITFVLAKGIGEFEFHTDIAKEDVISVLDEFANA